MLVQASVLNIVISIELQTHIYVQWPPLSTAFTCYVPPNSNIIVYTYVCVCLSYTVTVSSCHPTQRPAWHVTGMGCVVWHVTHADTEHTHVETYTSLPQHKSRHCKGCVPPVFLLDVSDVSPIYLYCTPILYQFITIKY